MDDDGTYIGKRAQAVGDDLTVEQQWRYRVALGGWIFAAGEQWAIRDADGRDVAGGAEVHRQARTARMVAAARVDQQHVWLAAEVADDVLQDRALP